MELKEYLEEVIDERVSSILGSIKEQREQWADEEDAAVRTLGDDIWLEVQHILEKRTAHEIEELHQVYKYAFLDGFKLIRLIF